MSSAALTTYNVQVYTGNASGAGTDANVYIILFGEKDHTSTVEFVTHVSVYLLYLYFLQSRPYKQCWMYWSHFCVFVLFKHFVCFAEKDHKSSVEFIVHFYVFVISMCFMKTILPVCTSLLLKHILPLYSYYRLSHFIGTRMLLLLILF